MLTFKNGYALPHCENCRQGTDLLFHIHWPLLMENGLIMWEKRKVCQVCLGHLSTMKFGKVDTPEIGSLAAQIGYAGKAQ